MDVRKLILESLKREGKVKAAAIIKRSGFSRAYVNRFLQKLRDEGKIVLIGKANKAAYVSAGEQEVLKARKDILSATRLLRNIGLAEDAVLADLKRTTGIFIGVPKNVSDMVDYGFSKMLNNAIEHSDSKTIKVAITNDTDRISFDVVDQGTGIFNNIRKKRNLRNTMEAIQDLLKGKQTTMPKMHSGEGIFFTSKVADLLVLEGSNKKLVYNNLLDDIFIRDIKEVRGTRVSFSISLKSKRRLDDLFRRYTDPSFEFSKTMVTVRLYRLQSRYISRSQARRIVSGLDKFKSVILDFKDVETVGQAFADEIFRVWKRAHPGISIIPTHANENVEFMITRALRNPL